MIPLPQSRIERVAMTTGKGSLAFGKKKAGRLCL